MQAPNPPPEVGEQPTNAAAPELVPELAPPKPVVPSAKELINLQFEGPKAALRPIFDALVYTAKRVGSGTKVEPALGSVTFSRRGLPYAAVKVLSPTKLALALALPDAKPHPRFKKSNRFADTERITHRVELTALEDVDADIVLWLKAAFERAKPPKAAAPKSAQSRG